MNGLYPIIRRVRRPLLPVEAPADAKPVNVPVAVVAEAVETAGAEVSGGVEAPVVAVAVRKDSGGKRTRKAQ